MTRGEFVKWLCITIGALIIILGGFHYFSYFRPHTMFSVYAMAMFTFLCILVFIVGEIAMRSTNKYLYNNIIVINFMLKLALSLLLVVLYTKVKPVDDNYFLGPFLLIYTFFTIFETYFMMKQANPK